MSQDSQKTAPKGCLCQPSDYSQCHDATCQNAPVPTDADSDDRVGCEACDATPTYDEAVRHFDIYLCAECDARWRAEADACSHEWEAAVSPDGDGGDICRKCSMFKIAENVDA